MIRLLRLRTWTGFLVLSAVTVVTACTGDPVRHPLDDSETRPADIETAVRRAESVLADVTDSVLDGADYEDRGWSADNGCATNPEAPEQGEVSRILYRSFPTPASGASATDIVSATEAHWERSGHTVGAGAPNTANQAITRIDGIGYSMVDAPPGVELRAFIPCFSI
ncbi:MAG: hypothetical protein OES24_02300 [Acidimicrobiia bacterium]|nr:hypothetical protein [Acidimicrobiia bacterium]